MEIKPSLIRKMFVLKCCSMYFTVILAVHPHLHPPQIVNHPQVPQTVNHPHLPHHQIPAVMKKGRNVGEKERRNKSCV